ncbi:hypothetical protein GCM10025767_09900 [Thalassotalea piscium]
MRLCPNCKQVIQWKKIITISRTSPIVCKVCSATIILDHPKQRGRVELSSTNFVRIKHDLIEA